MFSIRWVCAWGQLFLSTSMALPSDIERPTPVRTVLKKVLNKVKHPRPVKPAPVVPAPTPPKPPVV